MKQLYISIIASIILNCNSGTAPTGHIESGYLWQPWERVEKGRILGLYFDSLASSVQLGSGWNYIHPYTCKTNNDTCFVSPKGGQGNPDSGTYSVYDGTYGYYEGRFTFVGLPDSSTLNWGGIPGIGPRIRDIHSLNRNEIIIDVYEGGMEKFRPAIVSRVIIDTVAGNNAQVWPTFINYDSLPYIYNR